MAEQSNKQYEEHKIRHVFLMTGAAPNTRWLDSYVVLDDKGFIKTGMISCQKILAPHDGPLHVLLTCLKPVCRAFLPWATSEAAALSALLPQSAKDQLRYHLFTKYSKNREQTDQKLEI